MIIILYHLAKNFARKVRNTDATPIVPKSQKLPFVSIKRQKINHTSLNVHVTRISAKRNVSKTGINQEVLSQEEDHLFSLSQNGNLSQIINDENYW